MKLTDLIYKVSSAVRDASNLIRYPVQIAAQKAQNFAQTRLEALNVPSLQGDRSRQEKALEKHQLELLEPIGGRLQARSISTAADSTGITATTRSVSIQTPEIASLVGQKLVGRRGKYQVEKLLPEEHLYKGVWLANNALVFVKEYLLTTFNQRELNQVKAKLERLDSVSFKSGGVQDFRLIVPWDTSIDLEQKRGYVITKHTLENHCTLRQALDRGGAMPPQQVRQVLAQVLQTLLFLHNHTIRFADGSIQRQVPHGNLHLDSLLFVPTGQQFERYHRQFYIYVADLALWKLPFQAPLKSSHSTPAATANQDVVTQMLIVEDLVGLGRVGFHLLVGAVNDADLEPNADPKKHSKWAAIADEPLKQFVRRLLGLDQSNVFSSAEVAYRELRALPSATPEALVEPPIEPTQPTEQNWLSALVGLLLIVLLLGGIGGLWWLLRRSNPELLPPLPGMKTQPTALQNGAATITFPKGKVAYAIDGAIGNVSFAKSFQDELNARDARLQRYELKLKVNNINDAIAHIRSGDIAFALISLDNAALKKLSSNIDLASETVAYDGLAVYVAFSDFQRKQSVSRVLDGKISFEQLRQIFSGNSPQFKPYVPADQMAIDLFETQVLKPEQYQSFRRLAVEVKQPINRIFETLLKEFELNKTQGISFGRLSKVFGQCSVYPLAIGEAGQEVQALVQDNDADINPKLDLCSAKGSYWLHSEIFKNGHYPLIYRFSIVYPKQDGVSNQAAIAFSKTLQTDEGQCLLSEAGFVPLRSIKKSGLCDGSQK